MDFIRSSMITVALVAMMGAVQWTAAEHFRGGTMTWKPVPQDEPGRQRQVEITYKMGYRYDFTENGHDRCTPEAFLLRQELETTGNLVCEKCNRGADRKLTDLSYYCDDFDIDQNWASGSNTIIVDVPPRKREFDVSYQDCCWVRPLASHPTHGRGWKMMAHVNVRPRPDNGLINSSPISSPIPEQVFQQGCHYNLYIPVTDPDNDLTRCRIASRSAGECNSNPSHDKVCGATPFVTIHENCTLDFDTSGEPGYYAVTVMIEDFIDEDATKPLSTVSLLFLLKVEASNSCAKPRTISPAHGTCKTIPAEEPWQMEVVVEAGDPRKPISKIMTTKPSGMTTSELAPVYGHPNRHAITLYWTPSVDMVGRHTVCYGGLDVERFSSGLTCIILNVADIDSLRPLPEISTPADGANITVGDMWIIEFNTEIQRPSSETYITLVDEQGYGVMRLDTSAKSNDVMFTGRSIEFYPSEDTFPLNEGESREYSLRLDQGAAVSVGSCGMESEAYLWSFNVIGRALPATLPAPTRKLPGKLIVSPSPPRAAIPQCYSSSMEIFVSKQMVGGDIYPSIIHLNDPSCKATYYNDTHYVIGTPYGLCGTTIEMDQVEEGGRQVIQNIVYIPAQPYTNDSIITRDNNIEIHVTCNLTTKRYTYAEFDPDVKTIVYYENGYGNFNFTLRMLSDESFTTPFKLRDFPVNVDLNERLHFEAKSWAKAYMQIHLDSCRATPTSNPFDPVHYTFIRNGCALDDTVQFHPSGDMLRKRFSVAAFAFLGKHMHGSVFVHCDMRLCDSRNPNSRCAQGCTSDPELPTPDLSSRGDIAENDIPDGSSMRGDTPYFPSQSNVIAKRDVSKRDVSSAGLASTEAYQETDGPIRIIKGGDLGVPVDFQYSLVNWDLVEVVLIACVILLIVCLIVMQLCGCKKTTRGEKTTLASV